MIESLSAGAAEVGSSEITKSATDVASKMDFSKPLDFSIDNKTDFGKQLDFSEDKEVASTLSEKSDIIDTSKALDYSEKVEKTGGSYGDLKAEGHGWGHQPPEEVHHMPSWSAMEKTTDLNYEECPAIAMEYADHRQTASCGLSDEAREYRAEQKRLIDDGKFEEAMQMDIDDIHEKFGDKYDVAIEEMKEYYKELKEAGRV